MASVLEASHTIPPSDPFASFAAIAVEASSWVVAQLRNAGEMLLSICYLPSSFVGWVVQVSTEALAWLCAIFVATVEVVVLILGTLVGCLLVLLMLAAVCKMLSCVMIFTEKTSCKVLVIPATDQSIRERERKWESADQLCYGRMDSMAVSRTRIEESRGLGWRHTIWQTVTRYPNGSHGNMAGEGGQSADEIKDEKSDKHLGD
jgi:hypothetical protein